MVFLVASCGLVPFLVVLQEPNMQKKGTNKIQLAQLCSQIAFLILWGGLKNENSAAKL